MASNPQKRKIKPKPKHIWHLVTNHQNMLYILAAGMVMGPAGFRGKHYSDPLSKYPGWIPLFRNECNIPANFLNQATSEHKHLLPCIASFDMSTLTGSGQMLSRNGKMRRIDIPIKRKSKDDIAIFVRAPLPITLLLSIKFCTDEDMQAFKSAANDVSNVDLISQRVETEEELFSAGTEVPLKTKLQDENVDDYFPASGQAIGGMLAMLYHTANRSNLGLAAFRVATRDERDQDNNLIKNNSILSEVLSTLRNWMNGSEISEQGDMSKLFLGVIQELVNAQKKESPKRSIDVALEYLEEQLKQPQQKNKQQLEKLIADLRAIHGLGGGTITELLEQHKGSLSRSLLLFFLREKCTELMEFSHKLLNDGDYILAGILFGVRDNWLQLPKELRNPKLSKYVAFQMAETEQREHGDKLEIDARSPRPKPLREIFTSPSGKMTVEQKGEALKLARKYHWNNCIETRITLVGSDDLPEIERKGFELVIQGDVLEPSTEVDEVKFLHRLGQWPPIAIQDESEVLEKPTIKDESDKKNFSARHQFKLFQKPE